MSDDKTYEQWTRDSGVYADFQDYKKGMKAVRDYQEKERQKKGKKKA